MTSSTPSAPPRRWRQALRLAVPFAALCAVPLTSAAQSAIIYGSLGNFDISNDTGKVCHGFEVEMHGITPAQVLGSFSAQRYGDARILPSATGAVVRWDTAYNASTGQWATRTLPHTVKWFPGQCYQWNPSTYEDSGCEHFGTYTNANPTKVVSRWLCEDSAQPGVLVPIDPPTAVPMPNYYVQAPAQANNPPELVVEVEAPEPAEAPSLYGNAQWIRVFKQELPQPVALEQLMADNPAVVPMDLAQLEADWDVIQDEPAAGGNGNRRRKRNQGSIAPTTRAVVRRIEMYAYTGVYDPVTHEALCADLTCTAPGPDEIGDLLDVQMTAANVQPDALIVSLTGNGRVESGDKLIACGNKCAQPYDAGRQVTLTAKAGSGSTFSGWTGACSGTNATCTVSVNGAVNVGATFAAQTTTGGGGGGGGTTTTKPVKVGVRARNTGTITGSINGGTPVLNCGSLCSTSVAPGTSVVLSAIAPAGKAFLGWSGGGCSGTALTCTIAPRAAVSVEALFEK